MEAWPLRAYKGWQETLVVSLVLEIAATNGNKPALLHVSRTEGFV